MKYSIIVALILQSPIVLAECQNTVDGNLKVHNGQISCELYIEEPISDLRLRFLVQAVKVEADINYHVLELFSQLASTPNEITLPSFQAVTVSLMIGDRVLPINLDVQPKYKIKSNGSICQLRVIDFEPRVSKLKSNYLPPWFARSLQSYINKDPKLKKEGLSMARKALPKIQSYLGCQ